VLAKELGFLSKYPVVGHACQPLEGKGKVIPLQARFGPEGG